METINPNKLLYFALVILILLPSPLLWAADYGEWEDLDGPYYLPVGNYIDYGERQVSGSYVYAGKMYNFGNNGSSWD